ncbi:kti12, chromatin associated [Geranomyces michiganensis]|nr:kti12, chromatin associated [Geranomyces michiganensis]
MPLIVMCGVPGSGKTTRALALKNELEAFLSANQQSQPQPQSQSRSQRAAPPPPPQISPNVTLLNEESLGIDKRTAYSSPHEEKKARGELKSAVERSLSTSTITICDSLNYIKGFRYQLYCIARALGTPQCTVYCITPHDSSNSADHSSPSSGEYAPGMQADLTSRFEEPDSRNRWDAPLYTLLRDDPTPLSDIIAAIVDRAPRPPNLSTVVKPLTETNYLHEMDRATTEIVDAVYSAQTNLGAGGGGGVPGKCKLACSAVPIELPARVVGLPELRRLRRQFTLLNKHHTQLDVAKVRDSFVEYLNTNI